MKVDGKTALVTGAAGGLGRGFAEALLKRGAKHVFLLDIQTSKGIDTESELNKQYGTGSATFMRCDLTDLQQLEACFKRAVHIAEHLDIVVNNAALFLEDKWEEVLLVNLHALIKCSMLAVEHMDREKGGRGGAIINISSAAGLEATPLTVVYSASKHGVVGFTKSVALTLQVRGNTGITCSCLCPTFTKTDMLQFGFTELMAEKSNPASLYKSILDKVGVMEVSDVVRAFMQVLEEEHDGGCVVRVTPQGVEYVFPKQRKSKL